MRTFSSEAASAAFKGMIEVVVEVLRSEATSPAVLRMLLRFLQLLEQVSGRGRDRGFLALVFCLRRLIAVRA